eukprot:500284_1
MSVFSDISEQHTRSGPNNNIITNTFGTDNDYNNASFGRHIMKCGNNDIIKYQIKIDKMNSKYSIAVGIVSNLHHQNTNEDFDGQHAYCIAISTGNVYIDGKKQNNKHHKCKEGDTFCLEINMAEHKLYGIKNNDRKHICGIKTEPNLTYRFALSMYAIG